MKHNFDIRLSHIEGVKNIRADLLSHLRFDDFFIQDPLADSTATIVSPLRALNYENVELP
jgi:hypothetical protein